MVKKMQLWAPNHPIEYGGIGLGPVEFGMVSEALGRSPLGHYVFNCQAPDPGNIEILHPTAGKIKKSNIYSPLWKERFVAAFP